jgi:hypothetical protein
MNIRQSYSYSILRYIHDTSTGEFVNVGLVMFSPEGGFLQFKCRSTVGRVSSMFPTLKTSAFKALLASVIKRFDLMAAENTSELGMWEKKTTLGDILLSTLPKDDSSLVWSHISSGATAELKTSFDKIFSRQISKFDQKIPKHRRSDDDVWRTFRKDLEKRNLLGFFEAKSITGKDDEINFPFAWKNGIWHCIEPISFDLTAPDSIRDKAHKWLGQITSVTDSTDKFKVYLVLAKPKQENLSAAFEKAKSILEKSPVASEIYEEDDISVLVDKLSLQVAAHNGAQ